MFSHSKEIAALIALGTALSLGCSSGDSGDGEVGESSAAVTTADKTAFDFFVGKGLKNFQAAAIVGNLDQESNVNPTAIQPNGVGHGIAQWSKGGRWDHDGNDNVVWYAAQHAQSAWALNLQLEFIWYELTTFSEFGLAKLRATSDVTTATIAFEEDYEQCGHCEEDNRVTYAKNALAAFGHDGPPSPPTPPPSPPTGCGEVEAGRGLGVGKAIRSCDRRFELVLQSDGNLVEYGPVGAMWSTRTAGTDGFAAVMRADGDFALYGKHSNGLWSSATRSAGAVLRLQNDGNLVVRAKDGKALWTSNTAFAGGVAPPTGCGEIAAGHGLVAGESLTTCGHKFTLAMQSDGNLVMYQGGHAIWSSGTERKGAYKAQMQGDGNFVVYDWRNRPLWATGTDGHPGAFFAAQDDGNLVVYAPGSRAVWASNSER